MEDLDYTDDICLSTQNFTDFTAKLIDSDKEAKKVGMKINQAKIKSTTKSLEIK
jgi:hypothetical protein